MGQSGLTRFAATDKSPPLPPFPIAILARRLPDLFGKWKRIPRIRGIIVTARFIVAVVAIGTGVTSNAKTLTRKRSNRES